MSATNRTENYNLPIFIETDKPAWLVDFNGAMRSIDAQMKANAEAIALKSPILTFQDTADIDFTKSGDIVTANLQSAITDKVGRALVTPLAAPTAEEIVSINTNGNQSAIEIGDGLTLNNGVLSAIDLNLSNTGQATVTPVSGALIASGTDIRYALNEDGSVGKVYGLLAMQNLTDGTTYTVNTNVYVEAPEAEYTIAPVGIMLAGANPIRFFEHVDIIVRTTGQICFKFIARSTTAWMFITPSLYIFKDFGD